MHISSRVFEYNKDLKSAQDFLVRLYKLTKIPQGWFPDRLENNPKEIHQNAYLWEEIDNNSKSTIVALTTVDGRHNYFLFVHPNHYDLENEILESIEAHAKRKQKNDNYEGKLNILVTDGFKHREEILKKKGYYNKGHHSDIRLRSIDTPIANYQLPKGFQIRGIRNTSDYDKIANAIRVVFGHGEWFTGKLLQEMTKSNYYNKDLDLIVEANNGDLAAFCTFRMDPVSKITQLEPMGTLPNYRKLGLANSLILEGLKRSFNLGASLFYIGGSAISPAAAKLYNNTGYTEILKEYVWTKKI